MGFWSLPDRQLSTSSRRIEPKLQEIYPQIPQTSHALADLAVGSIIECAAKRC